MTEDDGFTLDPKVIRAARQAAQRDTRAINSLQEQMEFELVRFNAENAPVDLNVDLSKETIWASQQQIADLFGVGVPAVSKHISNIFDELELDRDATVSKMEIVRREGGRAVTRQVEHYNLDLILSVGYRVNSTKATAFRQWATKTLKAYLVDGYALNEARLKNDPNALRDLAAKVRELRSNEKNLYQGVRDVFAFATTDYEAQSQAARSFFARIQDKFVYAITDKNTGQILLDRADSNKPNMGLQSMKGSNPTKEDATVGKNYLFEHELYSLHILCEQFLLFVESKAIRGQKLTMAQMSQKFDDLIRLQGHNVFARYDGFIAQHAKDHALAEYAAYRSRLPHLGKPVQ